jgi:hypothetical protein
MELNCPVCGHSELRAHRAWRLETCPECHADDREVYLSESVGRPVLNKTARVRSTNRTRAALEHLSLPVTET